MSENEKNIEIVNVGRPEISARKASLRWKHSYELLLLRLLLLLLPRMLLLLLRMLLLLRTQLEIPWKAGISALSLPIGRLCRSFHNMCVLDILIIIMKRVIKFEVIFISTRYQMVMVN